ncbi:tyrosine-protein phosphatase non-receptor type substrate 1-like [Polyodon spathula]|uniref:tyrosine-protein phosphatase non-receptor type substrate 1-like n=1 Tax=Polyodon spathula TaxID=7913 RepID=UPI001B7F2495|nr:tyrosine-protein phosphatase non-receptor type substrate 1-like [Polyodon spathula]
MQGRGPVTGGPPGPLRWYRDTGSGRQYLYSTIPPSNERNDPRVSQVHPNHPTDLSIRIVRLTPRDSGMYYCDKYTVFDGSLIASGAGSRLSVQVKPDVSIEAKPERVKVNESVSLTCRARGFYPGRVNVSWVQQGGAEELAAERGENAENEDGTFSRDSVLNVTVTQELSAATVSCRVQIEGLLETVQREHTLVMTDLKPDPDRGTVSGIAIPAAVTLVVLIALLLAVGLYCRFRAGKKKAEIVRPPVLSNETHEKELTYASLDLQKKSSRHSMMVAESEVCAYAEIKGAKARNDLTYASLDKANLKKKKEEPGGEGEPPGGGTEYASVNFRKN